MPERQDALDRVRMGEAAMLLISPEQLRSNSVRSVLHSVRSGSGCWTRRIACRNGATISGPTTAISAASSRNPRAMKRLLRCSA